MATVQDGLITTGLDFCTIEIRRFISQASGQRVDISVKRRLVSEKVC